MKREYVRLLSTTGILGYGYPEESLNAGVARGVDLIGCDGGSTDPGPYYLGTGKSFVTDRGMRRDARLMLRAATAGRIPMIIGTCGGAGGAPHLEVMVKMIHEIAREEDLHFKLAVIQAEQDKTLLKRRIAENRTRPLGRRPPLDDATVDRAERIVALMGPEPYMEALDAGAKVILGGRSSDPAPFAAVSMFHGMPPAPSWFAGKMLECGSTAAFPKGQDCLVATVREDGVECEPPNPAMRCTPMSVANHSLHENASPIRHVEPGGILETDACRFDAVSDRAVRISGMRWSPSQFTVKLEAVELVGYRTISICGTRDPILIGQVDGYLQSMRENTAKTALQFGIREDDYILTFHTYGRNGVMGEREPLSGEGVHELGFVVDVVAKDPEKSEAVLAIARNKMKGSDFPGRLCRSGNVAFLFSPSDVEMGPVYRFSMSHVVVPDNPREMFPIAYETI